MKDFYQLTELGRARRLRQMVEVAIQQYPIQLKKLSLITNSQNGVFRLDSTAGEKYVMRINLPHQHVKNRVSAEIAWLDALSRDTDLLLPRPVATLNGQLYCQVSVEGVPENRYCVLLNWLPGRTLDQCLNIENMRRFGALAARLHLHGKGFQLPSGVEIRNRYDQVFPVDEPVVLFDREYASFLPPARLEIFRHAFDLVQKALDRLRSSGEPMRLLHGDLHPWNVKVYRQRMGVLDFEDMLWGWPVQDLGTTLLYFYGDQDYQDNRVAFKEGYERLAPWPEREPGEVDTFIAGRNLVLANFVLQEPVPEWKERAPRYFARVERRLRALLLGEGEFDPKVW